ncbi:hypothetical protein V1511DRAFT_511789 [Dipodascopsis uninucleata]
MLEADTKESQELASTKNNEKREVAVDSILYSADCNNDIKCHINNNNNRKDMKEGITTVTATAVQSSQLPEKLTARDTKDLQSKRPKFYIGDDGKYKNRSNSNNPHIRESYCSVSNINANIVLEDSKLPTEKFISYSVEYPVYFSSGYRRNEESTEDDDLIDADSDLAGSYSNQSIMVKASPKLSESITKLNNHASSIEGPKATLFHVENISGESLNSSGNSPNYICRLSPSILDDEKESWCWRNEVRKLLFRRKLRESLDKIFVEKFSRNTTTTNVNL